MRTLLRLDAALETVLAAASLMLAYRLLGTDRWTLPGWLGSPALVAFALVLLVVAVALGWLSVRPEAPVVRMIALANGMTAAIMLVWGLAGLGAGGQFRTLLAVAGLLLAVLAGAQFFVAQRDDGPVRDRETTSSTIRE
ncbi:hypothetical protein GCM10009765_25370 [Fodinicola feengrottensis]|uniref:Integral membrane protein n=1 Tax=Fodinicola feengrottensis TaxID=435914 RepID=A0ABP4SP34_9ACTN